MTPILLALLGCGTSCEVDGPLAYDDPEHWLCQPGVPGACPDVIPLRRVEADGSVSDGSLEAATDPGIACFAVYPTLDLRLGNGLHHDLSDVDAPARWARTQAGPLRQACALYVPVYRQAIVGTYVGRDTEKKRQCFDAAYADVLAAFEAFLEREPRAPIVLFGHSQGGQHLSRLIRERVESEPALLERLLVAYPVGWALGTAADSDVGGSFGSVPTCTAADQRGCVVGFRTFLQGQDPPSIGRFFEGEQAVCVHPGAPDAPNAAAPLQALTLSADHALLDEVPPGTPEEALLRYPGAFDARCTGSGQDIGLEVSWARPDDPPIDLEDSSITKGNGAHIIDLNLGAADIVDDIRRRAAGL